MGIETVEGDDLLIIRGGRPRGAEIETYHDHRMAMAFSLIGLRVDGITIENPSCVSKTFPNFFEVLETLQCVDSNVLLSPKGV